MPKLLNDRSHKLRRQELRRNMPQPEQKLWYYLRKKWLGGFKFRRQYGVGPFILDFYCPQALLAIELEGDSNFEPGAKEKDEARSHFIVSHGIKILRFTNNEIRDSLDRVLEIIQPNLNPPSHPPSERGRNVPKPQSHSSLL